jgi:acetyl-CoA carboxylase carboxyl transferase subunit beta
LTKAYENLVDEGSFNPSDDSSTSRDPLEYPGYREALATARERTGASESVASGRARIGGHEVEVAAFDFGFLGGSMGEATGEILARALERAGESGRPFVLRASTGGARMQEGMRSLIQMPKVVAARIELQTNNVPFISVLAHPTTGGVFASLASLGDVTYAHAGATVGFAGPRVAESFTGRPLSENSHTAESALGHGLVDGVFDEREERAVVANALDVLATDTPEPVSEPPRASESATSDAWEVVQAARAGDRLNPAAVVNELTDAHAELRGDRMGTDDRAVVCALARVSGRRCLLVALDRTLPPSAAGFRKATRSLEVASRLGLPVVTLVDTRGADPSEESEASGVAGAIANLFATMLSLAVPVVSIVTGEGGSGGALAFATADTLVAYGDSFFSVIGPEGAAQILWRDTNRAPEAARLLRLTAHDLKKLGIADEIVAGPLDSQSLRRVVAYHLDRAASGGPSDLASERRRRWRSL